MCDFADGFKLCTCKEVSVDKTGDSVVSGYTWELRKIESLEMAVGKARFPGEDIGSELEEEWVQLNLNDHHCFDFEYKPEEGDNLVLYPASNRVYNQFSGKYLSFIFRDGEWKIDFYDEIAALTEPNKKGCVTKI